MQPKASIGKSESGLPSIHIEKWDGKNVFQSEKFARSTDTTQSCIIGFCWKNCALKSFDISQFNVNANVKNSFLLWEIFLMLVKQFMICFYNISFSKQWHFSTFTAVLELGIKKVLFLRYKRNVKKIKIMVLRGKIL